MIPTVILLAGGFGTRLKSVIRDIPKPLAPVRGRPFLEYVLDDLETSGFQRVILSLHYMWESFLPVIERRSHSRFEISYVVEGQPLGTGGALKFACLQKGLERSLDVITANGDTYLKNGMKSLQSTPQGQTVCGLLEVSDAARYSRANWDQKSRIIDGFTQEPSNHERGWIHTGMTRLSVESLLGFERDSFSLERDMLPGLLASKSLFGTPQFGRFIDIGIPEDYQNFCSNTELFT